MVRIKKSLVKIVKKFSEIYLFFGKIFDKSPNFRNYIHLITSNPSMATRIMKMMNSVKEPVSIGP